MGIGNICKSRVIIAGLVQESADKLERQQLTERVMTFLFQAWEPEKLPGKPQLPHNLQIELYVEGEPRDEVTAGNLHINWMKLGNVETQITRIQGGLEGSKRIWVRQPRKPYARIAMGSKEYCQAFSHLCAASPKKNRAPSWALSMIRWLTNLNPRDIVWYDSAYGRTFRACI